MNVDARSIRVFLEIYKTTYNIGVPKQQSNILRNNIFHTYHYRLKIVVHPIKTLMKRKRV